MSWATACAELRFGSVGLALQRTAALRLASFAAMRGIVGRVGYAAGAWSTATPQGMRAVCRAYALHMKLTVLLPIVALLAGCATPGLRSLEGGLPEAEVIQRWGTPTARYTLPSGTRLEYATGPGGLETWMVDLDAAGRAVLWRQVLSYRNLRAVQGQLPSMTRDELLRTLGRPGHVRSGGRQGGEVWSWRHESPFCLWFQASLNDNGRVTDAAFAPDPICDHLDD